MSLLEDVFLQDEADEAQELERVIEGDEYDERPRTPDSNENSEREDEAIEEGDKRRVDPTKVKSKHVVKNPRFILNPARLTGPRGIQVIPEHFKDFKFRGKGHEKDDLDLVLKKLEHWAYRLYPKFQFEDCLKKIETLGKKRPVMVHLHKIRSDQFMSEETVVQRDSSDDEVIPAQPPEEDEFDKLLQQQIELARATPAPDSVKKPAFSTPNPENRSLTMPKVVSSPSINDEMRERILRNKRLAEERRLARLKQNTTVTIKSDTNLSTNNDIITAIETKNESVEDDLSGHKKHNRSNVLESSDEECDAVTKQNTIVTIESNTNLSTNNDTIMVIETNNEVISVEDDVFGHKKHNRSNVIESSDEECDAVVVNKSISVDVHDTRIEDNENVGEKSNVQESVINCNDGVEILDVNSKTNDSLNKVETGNNNDIDMIEQEPISVNNIANEISDKNGNIKDNVSTEKDKDVDMIELEIKVSNSTDSKEIAHNKDINNIESKDSTEENVNKQDDGNMVNESESINNANGIGNNSNKKDLDNMSSDEMDDYDIDEIMEQVNRVEESQDNL